GFVPFSSSNRFENEYGVFVNTPLSAEIVPFPSLSPPCHTAEAFRFMFPPISKVRRKRISKLNPWSKLYGLGKPYAINQSRVRSLHCCFRLRPFSLQR